MNAGSLCGAGRANQQIAHLECPSCVGSSNFGTASRATDIAQNQPSTKATITHMIKNATTDKSIPIPAGFKLVLVARAQQKAPREQAKVPTHSQGLQYIAAVKIMRVRLLNWQANPYNKPAAIENPTDASPIWAKLTFFLMLNSPKYCPNSDISIVADSIIQVAS